MNRITKRTKIHPIDINVGHRLRERRLQVDCTSSLPPFGYPSQLSSRDCRSTFVRSPDGPVRNATDPPA
jgi:hypothetical protein